MSLLSRILDWLLGPDDSWVCRHCGGDVTISGAPGREIRVCVDCGRAVDEVHE